MTNRPFAFVAVLLLVQSILVASGDVTSIQHPADGAEAPLAGSSTSSSSTDRHLRPSRSAQAVEEDPDPDVERWDAEWDEEAFLEDAGDNYATGTDVGATAAAAAAVAVADGSDQFVHSPTSANGTFQPEFFLDDAGENTMGTDVGVTAAAADGSDQVVQEATTAEGTFQPKVTRIGGSGVAATRAMGSLSTASGVWCGGRPMYW